MSADAIDFLLLAGARAGERTTQQQRQWRPSQCRTRERDAALCINKKLMYALLQMAADINVTFHFGSFCNVNSNLTVCTIHV